jgi:DNA-binding transcriptional MerR regulator
MRAYPIGEAARCSGVKVTTIRYYESIGLLPEPSRLPNNRRSYSDEAIRQLTFIKRARELDFEMNDIASLLKLRERPAQSCRAADQIARLRLREVDERLARLNDLREELMHMIGACRQQNVRDCRVIEGIERHPA